MVTSLSNRLEVIWVVELNHSRRKISRGLWRLSRKGSTRSSLSGAGAKFPQKTKCSDDLGVRAEIARQLNHVSRQNHNQSAEARCVKSPNETLKLPKYLAKPCYLTTQPNSHPTCRKTSSSLEPKLIKRPRNLKNNQLKHHLRCFIRRRFSSDE